MRTIIYTLSIALCSLLFVQCGNSENTNQEADTQTPSSDAQVQENTETYYVLAEAGLRMRADASLNGAEVETIKYGEKVQVNTADASDEIAVGGIKGKMVKSYHNDNEGYMFTGYLSSIPVPKIPTNLVGKGGFFDNERHIKLKKAYINELKEQGIDASYEKVNDKEMEEELHYIIPAANIEEAFLIGRRLKIFELDFDLPATSNPKTLTANVDGETLTATLSNPETVGQANPPNDDRFFFPFEGHTFSFEQDDRNWPFVTLQYKDDKLVGVHVSRAYIGGAWNMLLEAKDDYFVYREIGVSD